MVPPSLSSPALAACPSDLLPSSLVPSSLLWSPMPLRPRSGHGPQGNHVHRRCYRPVLALHPPGLLRQPPAPHLHPRPPPLRRVAPDQKLQGPHVHTPILKASHQAPARLRQLHHPRHSERPRGIRVQAQARGGGPEAWAWCRTGPSAPWTRGGGRIGRGGAPLGNGRGRKGGRRKRCRMQW